MVFHRPMRAAALLVPALALLVALLPTWSARANHTPNPTSVTIAGAFQSELGCPGDWQPTCATTHLTKGAADGIWRGSFSLPAGAWEYKAALNDAWDESYGKNGGSANIALNVAAAGSVAFYYDHATHWVTDNVNSVIATAAGSFQSEIGCPGDWSPDCLRSWLQDVDGDGIYTFETSAIPVGDYEFKVALNENWTTSFPASNVSFSITKANQPVVFSFNPATNAVTISLTGGQKGSLTKARAHWVTRDTIAWDVTTVPTYTYALLSSPAATMQLTPAGIVGTDIQTVTLTPNLAGLSQSVKDKFPYLKIDPATFYNAFTIGSADLPKVSDILKGQIAIEAFDQTGALVDATALQIPGVLDELYSYSGPLGVTFTNGVPTLRVWAPTAQSVALQVFSDSTTPVSGTVAMTLDPATGVWSTTGTAGWKGRYYLYDVQVFTRATNKIEHNLVTDPYSISLSTNSTRTQIIDLNEVGLKPAGWDGLNKPALAAPEDSVLYELHVRDFSIHDASVPAAERGTFKAFAEANSDGMRHLRTLAGAGLTHIHILPAFDCASIDENKANWQQPDESVLATLPPNSDQQQAAVKATRDKDGFNWCYDPYHYTTPEGSYSTNPDGPTRILEFREMVQALNQSGLRVVMDVVYNHTAASGQDAKSVLDKVVPGYYHRLNLDGNVETSTCCQNTASEHAMMEKLMVDSLVTWATAYKVDGFRFDLMGHHMLSNMIKVRDTLHALTPAKDGVDGSQIYIYGEGWNFGEVADNARGVNATQLNLAGSGIGSFNDRIRDAARGGGPFDSGEDMKKQGFATGLYVAPNDLDQGTPDQQKARALLLADQIRVGLAGNLKNFTFMDRTGVMTDGAHVDYNGSPTGYTSDPQEIINYDEAHDNMTLFDAIQLKAPGGATIVDRVRMQALGIDLLALGQGVPFFHAGQDILRSKSFDGNSYNSGDWFNRLDWTYSTNNFGAGLPPDGDSNWPIFSPLLNNSAIKPSSAQIIGSRTHFEEMLRIRKSSPLFRLHTAAEIQAQVSFLNTGPNQTPGLIVMVLTDPASSHFGNPYKRIVVVFNATPQTQTFRDPSLKAMKLQLHPIQAASADYLTRISSVNPNTGALNVAGRTTAVFVETEVQVVLPVVVKQ